jgi:hypothetical protein
VKALLRRGDASFSDDHRAYDPAEYAALVGRAFTVERTLTLNPAGILVAHGLDLLPVPARLPRRLLAEALVGLDRRLNDTPLARAGHLLAVVARAG